jgi:hypothetical protein
MILGSETLTVIPQTQTRVAGRYQLSPGTSRPITGTVLPIPGATLLRLEEGARKTAKYLLIVEGNPDIHTTDVATPSKPADRVTRSDGSEYTVATNTDFSIHKRGRPHRQFILHEVAGDE